MKKNLRHFDRERLIWDSPIEPRHKLILLAYNSFIGSGDYWPSADTIAQMTNIPVTEIKSQAVQECVRAWQEGLS